MDKGTFFAFAFRMKYINRWGLMKNSRYENLTEHSAETAMLAHALAAIGNELFGRKYDQDRIAVMALYHDLSETITGDLPTPVKYHSKTILDSYREIERNAADELCKKLPEELKKVFSPIIHEECSDEERAIIKAADKLSALIKCIEEENDGNREFIKAKESTLAALSSMKLPEAEYFVKNLLPAFALTLDEL